MGIFWAFTTSQTSESDWTTLLPFPTPQKFLYGPSYLSQQLPKTSFAKLCSNGKNISYVLVELHILILQFWTQASSSHSVKHAINVILSNVKIFHGAM